MLEEDSACMRSTLRYLRKKTVHACVAPYPTIESFRPKLRLFFVFNVVTCFTVEVKGRKIVLRSQRDGESWLRKQIVRSKERPIQRALSSPRSVTDHRRKNKK
ncbi:unnamed protein product [Ilex paraguariensis]|uniref:Uncharacterized protein n=1 Tax=Ilex paraguariensis TaxID=185542 RepID=A0ABC8TC09_9AQUA